ncbi:type II secretion system protein [Acaryochloris marina]|uniref:Uncharacterized protein n=1 Tax=Acaryochloris marina (strain MBIC 11017) TaxID=329726 RepID=B0C0H4_ACAM1|nr:type II secretion system protein [Acaryochloris marina]ABW30767.1 conserved hypothetical protein [Acaryochloris marina MBIC11017]
MFHFNALIPLRSSPSNAGFTLPEKMVICCLIGIAAAASAPSLMASMNRAKVKQTMAEVRSALNETQREAIKGNKICTLTLNFVEGKITGPCLKSGDRTLDADVAIVTNLTDPSSSEALDEGQPVLIGSDVQLSLGLSDGESVSQIAMAASPENTVNDSKAGMVVQIIAHHKNGNGNKEGGTQGSDNPPNSSASSASIPIKYGVLGNPEFAIVSAQQTPTDPTGKIVFYNPQDSQVTKRCIAISNTLGLTRIGTYQGDLKPTSITDSGRCTAENWEEQ